jgi:hypothetical protein
MVVTSIPEADNVNVTDVAIDPTAATSSLNQGGFAAVIASATPQDVYTALLDDVQNNAQEGGGAVTESQYGGVTITSWTPKSGDDFSSPGAVAMVGDFVAYAMRAEDIQPLIDTFNGDTPNLSTNAAYQQVNGLLPTESLAHGYVDGPAILKAITSSAPEQTSMLNAQTTSLMQAQTGFALVAEQDGFRLVTKSVGAGDAAAGMSPVDGSFFDKVPSNAVLAINGTNIDSTGALTMLAFVFASNFIGQDAMATPAGAIDVQAMQAEVFAKAEQMLGFNLKTDFIDHLNGEFGVSVAIPDITADTPQVNALIVSHVDDPQAVTGTIAKISLIVGAALGDQTAVHDEKVGDATVSVIDGSVTGVGDVAFGVIGEDLVIAIGDGLNDYTNGASDPMSQDANYQAVMDHLPKSRTSITYVNMPVLIGLAMDFSSSMSAGMEITDADPACGDYATQAEAQAAYDADQFEHFNLDQDFDGTACEDYFNPGTPAATPATVNPYPNVLGLGSVTSVEDGVYSSETFLLIGGE